VFPQARWIAKLLYAIKIALPKSQVFSQHHKETVHLYNSEKKFCLVFSIELSSLVATCRTSISAHYIIFCS